MQQHAAQHILSAAFWDYFNIPTIGFHLGKEIVTIDLEAENLPNETVEKQCKLRTILFLKTIQFLLNG